MNKYEKLLKKIVVEYRKDVHSEELMGAISEAENSLTKELDWFDEWYDLFPSGIKSGTKMIKGDRKGTFKKLNNFIKEYDFTKEQIIQATKNYLNELSENDYKYCLICSNFINHKDKGSELAARCENLDYSLEPEKIVNSTFFI